MDEKLRENVAQKFSVAKRRMKPNLQLFHPNKLLTYWWYSEKFPPRFCDIYCNTTSFFNRSPCSLFSVADDSEKADLKPRHDSHIGVPHLDSIYTTPTTGFHHPHHGNGIHHGSPEAMKVRMAAMVLSPPTRV